MGIHTKKSAPVKGGDDAKTKPLSVLVGQDPTPFVKFYWAPSQETMNIAPLVYVTPDEFPVQGRPVEIIRVVRLYYDGQQTSTPQDCHEESWILNGVSGPFIADAGYPRQVFGPAGLDGIADNGVTFNYLIGNGDIEIGSHVEATGDCQKSFCWYGDLGQIDGSPIQADTLLTLAELQTLFTDSEVCLTLTPDPNPNDGHGVSTDPGIQRMGGEYAGGDRINLIGMNFNPPGATSGHPGGGSSGPDIGAAWRDAFLALKADLESNFKNLYVTVVDGKEDKFLELFTPAIDETDFVGFDVLHIAVELSRSGTYEETSDAAFLDYSDALQTQFEFFPRLRTVVYNDIGDPGDTPENIVAFESFLEAAAADLVDFGFEYGGEVDYHSPNTGDMRALIVDHFKL